MTDIIMSGISGKMGQSICHAAELRDDCRICAGIDLVPPQQAGIPYAKSFDELTAGGDVIVDFSNPAVLPSLLRYAQEHKTPAVLCTTGYSKEQIADIEKAAETIPVFRSGNMSLGINLMLALAKKAAAILGDDFDVEIIEQHHNLKLDAPSGTALMIADAVREVKTDAEYIYDRHSYRRKREKKEIGIHSIRGGSIVGEHQLLFAGQDEVITISHSARSKTVFAVGALNAAVFLKGRAPGLYDMSDLLASK